MCILYESGTFMGCSMQFPPNFHIFALLKHYYLAMYSSLHQMRLFSVIFRQCVIYSLIDDCMLSGRKAQQEVVCSVTTAWWKIYGTVACGKIAMTKHFSVWHCNSEACTQNDKARRPQIERSKVKEANICCYGNIKKPLENSFSNSSRHIRRIQWMPPRKEG